MMRIESARVLPVRFDFRFGVAHSLASRSHSVNICVIIESDSGFTGYGEGVPRSYVTGETPESVMAALAPMLEMVRNTSFASTGDVISLLERLGATDSGKKNLSALCALDLALIDLAGKHWNKSAHELLGLQCVESPIYYSLIIPLLPESGLESFLKPAREFNFTKVKIKVDSDNPAGRVAGIKKLLGNDIEIRVDVNCAWNRSNAPGFFRELAELGVVSVEQPLPADDLQGMAELRSTRMIPITLDESATNPADVERAASMKACDIINVRISKSGGLLGSLRVIEQARACGLGIQLGAQVGESCILSHAGAVLASSTPSFKRLEGYFGTHLLSEDICRENIRFGYGGQVKPTNDAGLCSVVDPALLEDAHQRFIDNPRS